jgi:hypothetical protein
MAYLMSYNCVQPAGGGQQSFPTDDLPGLQEVQLARQRVCQNDGSIGIMIEPLLMAETGNKQ